uniref:(California timema) hypothetical protein n=1 Tax=Timema californicum TaxID=61474 RepID=A0A7R9JKZ8_TIMCA|nr:unnamed protein product [Timema californicum]
MLRAALTEGVEPPPALHSEDIAGAVVYALGAPQHVQCRRSPTLPLTFWATNKAYTRTKDPRIKWLRSLGELKSFNTWIAFYTPK